MINDDDVREHNTVRTGLGGPFLDREQQPMTLPPFANTIDCQLLH